jgi:transcriptional regulator with XRE-family HTH domain
MAELTPEANRAARAILKWSVRDLAEKAGIAFTTVHRFETTGTATETTKDKIKAAYAAHDVEITNGEFTGARLRLRKEGRSEEAARA